MRDVARVSVEMYDGRAGARLSSLDQPAVHGFLVLRRDLHVLIVRHVEVSGSLGPDSVSSTPSDEACLDLARSKMSTPIQESSAQLSGPDIPGAQINEDGKWVLMVKSAVSINPVFFESCGASINAIMEGWKLVFSKDES